MSIAGSSFAAVAASTGEPIRLSMQRLWLTGQVLPAGARLLVQHVFECAEKKPVEVIYAFPLPREAALRRFRIAGEGFESHSELKETEEAVQVYEQGIAAGSLAAIARQYSLFSAAGRSISRYCSGVSSTFRCVDIAATTLSPHPDSVTKDVSTSYASNSPTFCSSRTMSPRSSTKNAGAKLASHINSSWR